MTRFVSIWTRRIFWLFVSVLSLPGIVAIAATLLARLLRCLHTGDLNPVCQSLGYYIHQALQYNLNLFTFYFPLLGLPLWIALFLAHQSFKGWQRIVIVFVCIWGLPHSYSFLGIVASSLLQHRNCEFHRGNCILLGKEMGSSLLSQGTSLWLLFLTLPVCVLVSLFYLIFFIHERESIKATREINEETRT